MKAETLKKAILQYAMQGKLVEQDPNDEPAKLLLERIKTEKEQLIKDGKIKKEKPLPPISEDEIPYELPQSWEWVRLKDVVYNHGQKKPNQTFSYIDIGSINNKQQRLNINESIIKPEDAPSRARKIVEFGDVIYSTVRPYLHNMCIIDKDFSCEPIASTGFAVLCCHTGLYNKFLLYYLLSPDFDSYANNTDNSKGVAYPAINDDRLYKALVPIPPLDEQQRIVEKLEQILPLVEEYGKNEAKLSKLNETLPDKIKQSILQHAVQGKLVPQNPSDEPASELLKRIKAEKEQLIKDGKIKKEKPLPPITEDEIPYELPKGWEWVRLRDLTEIITKGSSPSWQGVNYTENKEVLFITSENVGKFKLLLNKIKYVEYKFNEIEPRSILEYNDILMNIVGASIGRTAIFNLENTLANINQATCIIRIIKSFKVDTLLKYLLLFFNSSICYMYMNNDQVDSARANLSMTNIANFLIPIPPLAEQQRIVTKVEELLAVVDKLKKG